jgi:branched-chain amino acid aminotransferase
MAKTFLPYAYLRWAFLSFQDANISIATHALHYGTAAFWGIRVTVTDEWNALFFRLDDHAKRLSRSAHYLGYEIAPEFIRSRLIEFVEMNKPTTSIYIRPLVYTSDLDISPRLHEIEKDFLIYGIELGDYLSADGVSATISSWVRQSDASFPLRAKISGGYITSALAKSEAVERWFDEALMMNSAGKLSEWSGMNVFLVRGGTIITPGVTEDILEGITRSSVISIARHLGYEVIERSVDKSELFIADEVFLTGTAARITPVKKIEQYTLPTDRPVFSALKSYMNTIFSREATPFSHWIEEIKL